MSHHKGPQYFGYLANTPPLRPNFRGMTDFFTDMAKNALPKGGVFYIRGGYTNQMGLKPPITNPNTPRDEITAINNPRRVTTTTPATATGSSARPWLPV